MLHHPVENGHNKISESDLEIIEKSIITTLEERKFLKPHQSGTKTPL